MEDIDKLKEILRIVSGATRDEASDLIERIRRIVNESIVNDAPRSDSELEE